MVSTSSHLRNLSVLVVLILAITVPFSDRAFHLDDVYFLRGAEIISRYPLRPYAEDPNSPYHFYDRSSAEAATANAPPAQNPIYRDDFPPLVGKKVKDGTLGFESAVHPPLLSYFIALVTRLSGGLGERSQHLAYLIFTLMAALTAYALACRFTRFPLWTALVFSSSCVFVISAHSVMSDMPMLAFFQTAIWLYVLGIDRADKRYLLGAGLFMTLAFLTRYAGAVLLPILLLYGLLKRARPSHSLLPFVVFLLLYGAWEVPNLLHYGRPHFLASLSLAYKYAIYRADPWQSKIISAVNSEFARGLASLAFMGGTFIFPPSLLIVFMKSRPRAMAYATLLLFCLILVRLNIGNFFPNYTSIQYLLMGLFLSLGLFLLISLLGTILSMRWAAEPSTQGQWRDDLFLWLWLLMVLGGATVAFFFAAARYLLPLSFPLAALFINQASVLFSHARGRERFFAASFGCMLIFSLNLAFADYKQAEIYRSFVKTHVPAYQAHGSRIWYLTGWGGFLHYMDQAGGQNLPMNFNTPMLGEVIIVPSVAGYYDMSPWLRDRVQPLESVSYSIPTPWRLLDKRVHTGYYTHIMGFLPFSLLWGEAERFDVYVVTKDDFFWRTFTRAQRQVSGLGEHKLGFMTIDGKTYTTLFEHPTARITYRFVVPHNVVLALNVGMSPAVWRSDMGDGVLFELTIAEAKCAGTAPAQLLFSKYIDPKNNKEDRKWHPAVIDLSAYDGKEVNLTFITKPGPQNNAFYDWAGWGNLEFRMKASPLSNRWP